MTYIYIIKNDLNNHVYIGKTSRDLMTRFKEHISDSKRKRDIHRPLQNAIRKYGEQHFSIELLETCEDDQGSDREIYWINYYNSFKNGYNATLGGDGKILINYKKIISLYDKTLLSQKEIAKECNCSVDTVRYVVPQYRENVDWGKRYSKQHKTNSAGIKGISVKCVETGEVFSSCTQAANWLVKEGKIKSQCYGRNKIPEVCRGIRKTVGGYTWNFV